MASWDLTAVIQATEPDANYFQTSLPGTVPLSAEGRTTFAGDPADKHTLLDLPADKERIIDRMIDLVRIDPSINYADSLHFSVHFALLFGGWNSYF